MPIPAPLDAASLRRRCDPDSLSFRTTAELPDLDETLGQERALEALRFGVGMRHDDYNIFAFGFPGVGKHEVVRRLLQKRAADRPVPSEWCYVHNFAKPGEPRALRLPPGRGERLRRDMDHLLDEIRTALPAVFESDEFRSRREALEQQVRRRQQQSFEELQRDAEAHNLRLMRTPMGMALAPVRNGEVLGPEEFNQLAPEEQQAIQREIARLQERLQELMGRMPQLEQEVREQIRGLIREATAQAVGYLIDGMKANWRDLPEIERHLEAVRRDIVENVEEVMRASQGQEGQVPAAPGAAREIAPLRKYRVNPMVDNGGLTGAPVIYEDHPIYQNLFGTIEHMAQFGALITDFTLIRPGALHEANGGYLVLDARKVLMQPFVWEELKRTLRARCIRIESLGQALSLITTVSLRPEPIPLDVKVVLIGDRSLYYLLSGLDPEFNDLFKVPAEFSEEIDRDAETTQRFARLIATIVRRETLRPFGRDAVARVIEHAARKADDAFKLSVHRASLVDLLREADHWAAEARAEVVTAAHVEQAIAAQIRWRDRIRERTYEMITREVVLIDTDGAVAGQINGLAVAEIGGFRFARPSRITARVRLGRGQVVDIEREVALGGPIHSKGVLILQGFLGARFAQDKPLTLTASLVFEQSYGGIEGDSASSAELYALLSALADAPIAQSFAVTGSVNQRGEVQAIGGVNEKIEGFFDICRARGLTGRQGVLIPRANVQNLMLRPDVVAACEAGQFRVYAVETIDQGIEILTGVPAGERGADGRFADGTINGRVEARLLAFAEAARAFARGPRGERQGEDNNGVGPMP